MEGKPIECVHVKVADGEFAYAFESYALAIRGWLRSEMAPETVSGSTREVQSESGQSSVSEFLSVVRGLFAGDARLRVFRPYIVRPRVGL